MSCLGDCVLHLGESEVVYGFNGVTSLRMKMGNFSVVEVVEMDSWKTLVVAAKQVVEF